MTFAVLRALHAILGDALDDIEAVYNPNYGQVLPLRSTNTSYASPPPSPSTSRFPLDFPSLDVPCDPNDPAEQLTAHPVVVQAINRIVAAAGQIANTVQAPFYCISDASMGYHLPSCLRLLEASHTVEILREAGPNGLHVDLISQRNGVESGKLAHILRLLATHHFIRERIPNVFAINRISSLIDSGKSFEEVKKLEKEGRPEMKYHDTNGIAAFVGMCTDELFKSSGFLSEAYLLDAADPPRPPFEHAFNTNVGFFTWLEGEAGATSGAWETGISSGSSTDKVARNQNKFRLERFGTAMSGTGLWEAPGAVLNGFDWRSLPRGSIIVDVGGGIGSTSMFLANAFCRPQGSSPPVSPNPYGHPEEMNEDLGFKFVIQDRGVVVEMGEKAWRTKCPELLDSGTVQFQVHNFFTTQPIKNAAVFFLRVIMHDWPDASARSILLHLREAATPETKLVLADFVLPLACVDQDISGGDEDGDSLRDVEGAESRLAPVPLLANLGKSSANAYFMDLTMQVMFNSKERTLRETSALALSAGWKVVKVTCAPGSLFGHIVAVPVVIPIQRRARSGSGSAFFDVPSSTKLGGEETRREKAVEVVERASSRCGTPTFGSRTELPSMQEAMARFGGGVIRSRAPGSIGRSILHLPRPGTLKQAPIITTSGTAPPIKKKKPSPLSLSSPLSSPPSLVPYKPLASPRLPQPVSPLRRRMSFAQLHHSPPQQGSMSPVPPLPQPEPPSPMSPIHPPTPQRVLTRHKSHAQLSHTSSQSMSASIPPSPLLPSEYISPPTAHHTHTLSRTKSHTQLQQHHLAPSQNSSIPVRQTYCPSSPLQPPLSPKPKPKPKLSPSLSYVPRSSPPPPPPRQTLMPRRSSHAQLSQTSGLRKRSGSIIGSSIGSVGIGGAISMASLLEGGARGSGGGVLNCEGGVVAVSDPRVSATRDRSGSALAAAARIKRGVPSRQASP